MESVKKICADQPAPLSFRSPYQNQLTVRVSLLIKKKNVGMKIRKSIADGYKTTKSKSVHVPIESLSKRKREVD